MGAGEAEELPKKDNQRALIGYLYFGIHQNRVFCRAWIFSFHWTAQVIKRKRGDREFYKIVFFFGSLDSSLKN